MYNMQPRKVLSIAFFSIDLPRGGDVASTLQRFGDQLRKVREKKGISQEKLGELAGLHRTYVSNVERGRCNISLLNIEKLAVALGVPMAKLMP